jgi:UPF0176 protein
MDVCTFYRFVRIEDPAAVRLLLHATGESLGLRGTVLLGSEGINATMCGDRESLELFLAQVRSIAGLEDLEAKYSRAESGNQVFHRLKVRVRQEIVTLGVPGLDPSKRTGVHVCAERWNALLDDPSVVVIDTRNRYECDIGTFPGALRPDTDTFREFPDWVKSHLDPGKHPRIAMFCTGGIRCEKASSFMLEAGFTEVCQLDGGILRYLETVAPEQNRWEGECFVFDQRVSVDPSLEEGEFSQCFACRRPVSAAEREHPDYLEGISCPHCAGTLDEAQLASFVERRRQVVLAGQRGELHVGQKQVSGRRTTVAASTTTAK